MLLIIGDISGYTKFMVYSDMTIEFPYQLPVKESSERYEHPGQVKTFFYCPADAARE